MHSTKFKFTLINWNVYTDESSPSYAFSHLSIFCINLQIVGRTGTHFKMSGDKINENEYKGRRSAVAIKHMIFFCEKHQHALIKMFLMISLCIINFIFSLLLQIKRIMVTAIA